MHEAFDSIDNLLHSCSTQFSVVALNETWMNEKNGDSFELYKFPEYEVYNVNRQNKKGGGTALYIKSAIDHLFIKDLSYAIENCFEVVTVQINVKHGQDLVVACLYRPPNVSISVFLEHFTAYLNKIKTKKVFICGDFNIDLLKSVNDNDTGYFLDTTISYGLYPLIDKPTRIQETSCTAIDNIFTNIITNSIKSKILIDDITDHLPVLCIYSRDDVKQINCSNTVKRRKVTEKTIGELKGVLNNINWNDVYETEDVNMANKKFTSRLMSCFNKCCPLTITTTHRKNNKPWLTNGLINACRKKNYLYKCQLKSNDSEAKLRYRTYKNKLTSVLRKAEKQYYNNKLAECKNDMKGTWNVLNKLCGRNKEKPKQCEFIINKGAKVHNEKCITDAFNDFYINVGPQLASKIDSDNVKLNYDDFLKDVNCEGSMFVAPTNDKEVLNIVSKFIGKSSEDVYGLSMKVIKLIMHEIIKPVTYICNLSLKSGVFPNDLKTAKVLPLFKSGDKSEVSNYRPVSILPQLSKILEKLFEIRLRKYIDEKGFLFKGQYGFRKNHSTNLALNEMANMIVDALDNKMYSIGVFIDLKKAFDTVDHKLLINKFRYYGIRGIASNFLKSYLGNRTQFVKYKDNVSNKQEVVCGVPQGSILGPLLFILYINDMYKVSELLHFIIFADDTNIFYLDRDTSRSIGVIFTELVKLSQWFKLNKISLNVQKSNYMLFGVKNNATLPVR